MYDLNKKIYLDNAATTMMKPKQVVDAVVNAMCSLGNAGRGGHEKSLDASRIIFETRDLLTKLFGGNDPKQLVFTMNSTESLNIAIKGILEPGDHVITTEMEHNSVLRPIYELEKKGVEVTIIPCDRQGIIDYADIESSIKVNTKAIVCTHCSNLTGNLVDIKRVGKIASDNNLIFVVDASQSAGVFEIDVEAMNIDVLCFTGHKGLLGPQGTGGLYVKEGVEIKPLLSGGSGIQTFSKAHPKEMPTALEAGTLNGHGIAGLCAAVKYLNEYGIDNIRDKEQILMRRFYTGVKDIEGVTIYGDFEDLEKGRERGVVVALNIGNIDSGQISDLLGQHFNISTRPGGHCAPLMHKALGTVEQGAVRFSFSHFNTEEEIDVAVKAVRVLAEAAQSEMEE